MARSGRTRNLHLAARLWLGGLLLSAVAQADPDNKKASAMPTCGTSYFIAADKVSWNYAPSGTNKCFDAGTAAALLARTGETRVGGTYVKAQYREYTDASFSTLKPRDPAWEHLGSLGPALYGVVGCAIRVVFRNNLAFPVSMAPAGGLQLHPASAPDVPVPPGATVTYLWTVPPEAGPASGSSTTSRLWLYRSSTDPVAHDNAGLVGGIIVTPDKKAGPNYRPKDVDREIITVFQVVKEEDSAFSADHDPELTEGASPVKMTINGYTWCNMPLAALTLTTGQRVRWHLGSVGTEDGLHNFHWHGNVVELNDHNVDQFTGIPTATYSVNMVPDEPGNWMMHCHVNDHLDGGMVTLYAVAGPPLAVKLGGVDRVYYVAAEDVEWNYLGTTNAMACSNPTTPFDPTMEGYNFIEGPDATPAHVRLGPTQTKALFVEYTDATFTVRKQRAAEDAYLGLLGPVLRAQVGDTIRVVFLNRASINASMHPHGVRYAKAHEGAPYEDGSDASQRGDDVVVPGKGYTYVWKVPDRSGPGPADPSSLMWMYHSHWDETGDTNAGLMGAIIVTRKKQATSTTNLVPKDVDREVVVFFSVLNEIVSTQFMNNLARVAPDVASEPSALEALLSDPDFQEHALRHSINGYLYCNMPPLRFAVGQLVRVHVMALGTVVDLHTPTWVGHGYTLNGQRSETVQMAPGGMLSTDVMMTSPGNFELQCRVGDHVRAGMRALYTVLPSKEPYRVHLSGAKRTYYIQAEPATWDYAPGGYAQCSNTDLADDSVVFLNRSASTIGSVYRKAVYREYTDASFRTRKAAPPHQGLLGPTITAEVGDQVVVVFRNALYDLPDWPVNLAPGGGLLDAGTDTACLGAVALGTVCTYRWTVPDTSGPAGNEDFNTVAYGYTSSVDVATSPSAGLVGLLVVAAKGQLDNPNKGQLLPKGVDAMVPLYWQAVDENANPYLPSNAQAAGLDLAAIEADPELLAEFEEGNMMHSINGYSYCNMPRPVFKQGTRVRWVLLSYGTEVDLHSPLFQNQALTVDRTGYNSLASLMPSATRTADMVAGAPGTWLISCAVHDHYNAGMMAQFDVV